MSYTSKSHYFMIKGKTMIWDREKKTAREATCADCCNQLPITIHDEFGLCDRVKHMVRCMILNCAKEPDDMACVDFERVS